jgi:folate-binding protein YgfZ
VVLEDVTSELTTIALQGPQADAVLAKIGAPTLNGEYDHHEWNQCLVVRMPDACFFLFTPPAQRDALVQQLESAGAFAADAEAFQVVRIEQGRPRYGEDISERFLAQEANLPRALHFQKGCYLGQEIVERVRSRGQVHRLLMPVEIDSTEPPAPGSKLPWGEITSAAYSPARNKVVALAYVRTELATSGTELPPPGHRTIVR